MVLGKDRKGRGRGNAPFISETGRSKGGSSSLSPELQLRINSMQTTAATCLPTLLFPSRSFGSPVKTSEAICFVHEVNDHLTIHHALQGKRDEARK